MIDSLLFEGYFASHLEYKRKEARAKRHITFDCYLATVNGDGKVHCKHLPRDVPLLAVLGGKSTLICKSCPNYDDGGETE